MFQTLLSPLFTFIPKFLIRSHFCSFPNLAWGPWTFNPLIPSPAPGTHPQTHNHILTHTPPLLSLPLLPFLLPGINSLLFSPYVSVPEPLMAPKLKCFTRLGLASFHIHAFTSRRAFNPPCQGFHCPVSFLHSFLKLCAFPLVSTISISTHHQQMILYRRSQKINSH